MIPTPRPSARIRRSSLDSVIAGSLVRLTARGSHTTGIRRQPIDGPGRAPDPALGGPDRRRSGARRVREVVTGLLDKAREAAEARLEPRRGSARSRRAASSGSPPARPRWWRASSARQPATPWARRPRRSPTRPTRPRPRSPPGAGSRKAKSGLSGAIDRIDPGLMADLVIKATTAPGKGQPEPPREGLAVPDQRDHDHRRHPPGRSLHDRPDRGRGGGRGCAPARRRGRRTSRRSRP